MQSIQVTLFSALPKPQIVIFVPILDQAALMQRVEAFAKKHQRLTRYLNENTYVNCRELFQERGKPDLFFFPSATGKCLSLHMLGFGEMFFLRHDSYGFTFCFSPNIKTKFITQATVNSFSEVQNYPPKVIEAASFFLSSSHISILVSEHGRMTADSDGKWVLRGIEIAFLQKKRYHGKSAFMQRKNECVSPDRPLRADSGLVNLSQRYKRYIKVRCVCNEPGFCYSAQFFVLSEQELEQEIIQDQENRRQRYGEKSHLYTSGPLEHCLLQPSKNKHFVILPPGMGINVPFGDVQGGKMFFSYVDKPLPECSLKKFKLIFFPPLFNPGERLQVCANKSVKDFSQKKKNKVSFCGSTKATIFTSSRINLVSCSSSEYKLSGAKVEMISTKSHGGWGVCFSCETINLASSPLPGSSGVGYRKSTIQATATVSVPPDRQGQQAQQEGRVRPGPVPFGGVSFRPYGSHPYGPLPFYGGLYSYKSPIIPHTQTAATVSSASEKKSQHTQQEDRSGPLSGPSGIKHREDAASLSHAESTVVVQPERQGKQTQKRSRSPFRETSGVRHPLIRPIIFRSQPASHGTWPFSGAFYPYPLCLYPLVRQGQWMPAFPFPFPAVNPSVAAFNPLRYEIPVQEEASASIPIGTVQQTSIWKPYEEPSSEEVLP